MLGEAARRRNSSSSLGAMEVWDERPVPSVLTWIPTTRKYGCRMPTLTLSRGFFYQWNKKSAISSNGISFFCLSQCIQQSILHCVKTLHNKTNPTKNVETSKCYIHKSNHLFKQENAWLSHFFSTHICQTIIRHGSHKIKDSVRQRISLIINFSSFIS